MRPAAKRGAAACLVVLLAASLLSACGAGGEGSSSTESAAAASSVATDATPPASTQQGGAGDPAAKPAADLPSAKTATERRSAGRAAPFVKPQADNSIPTFGAEAPASQSRAVEAALRSYLQARAGGRWSRACSWLAAGVRGQIEGFAKSGGCAAAYAALAGAAPPAARANPLHGPIAALRSKGASGFVLFYGPAGAADKYVMPVLREAGEWKVSQLEAVPYPLGRQTQS
jgi:hypothetical protein